MQGWWVDRIRSTFPMWLRLVVYLAFLGAVRRGGSRSFSSFFFNWPRDSAPSVFEVWLVNFDALFELTAFFPCPFLGVPLSASPAFWVLPLEGIRRMIYRPCADWDADLLGVLYFVIVWVVDFYFFLKSCPPPLVPFFADSLDTVSFPPFSRFLTFFILFCFPSHCGCDLLGYKFSNDLGVHWHFSV